LGTGRIASARIIFRSFTEARKFAQSLGLEREKGENSWRGYWKSEKKPDDIPYRPERTYASEWKGWKDFLGY
jgi:hypothetical protein